MLFCGLFDGLKVFIFDFSSLFPYLSLPFSLPFSLPLTFYQLFPSPLPSSPLDFLPHQLDTKKKDFDLFSMVNIHKQRIKIKIFFSLYLLFSFFSLSPFFPFPYLFYKNPSLKILPCFNLGNNHPPPPKSKIISLDYYVPWISDELCLNLDSISSDLVYHNSSRNLTPED